VRAWSAKRSGDFGVPPDGLRGASVPFTGSLCQ
jgi:hypothetical protein